MNKIAMSMWLMIQSTILFASENHIHIHVKDAQTGELLIGANVYWAGTTVGTATDESGEAEISEPTNWPGKLIVSYIGYIQDTILVEKGTHHLEVLLNAELLETTVIENRKKDQYVSVLTPAKTEVISQSELRKAACCNLSESFQTNASVEINYEDAATGAKEIMMLGLEGVYVQTGVEQAPTLRGLAATYGMDNIPAPWIQSIAVAKGVPSVKTGYEGITGSINVAFKNPETAPKFYSDVFVNSTGRLEANVVSGLHKEHWGTAFFVNGAYVNDRKDRNKDNFLDQPGVKQLNLMNHWEFHKGKVESNIIVKSSLEERRSGQPGFTKAEDYGTTHHYGIGIATQRVEAIAKTGIVLDEERLHSIAFIGSGFWHHQDGFYGLKTYEGTQGNFYGNLMYQGIISNTQHNITAGLTMMYDQYNENVEGTPWQRKDIVPGGFAEYTWKYLEKITLVAGMRIDKPNRFNWQFNPRLHFRYTPVEGTVIRLAGGRGFRIPNIFAENPFVFASSRTWMIHEKPQYEAAWNSGISFMQSFKIAEKKSSVQVDFFRTQFVKNVIVDIENSDNTAMVYNIGKGSYANSFLVEWNIEPIARFDIKIAYKWEDVKMQQKEGLIRKSMISPHRGLLVLSYKTKNEQWMFNTQWSLHGRHRLPNSFQGNTQQYSPVYALGGIQVTRYQKKFEFFLGAENLLNTRQRNPIIGAENPFGDKFDTYQVWGPVIGTIAYGGIRATI